MYSYEKGIKNSTLAWRVKFIPFFCTSRRRRTDNLRFTHLHSKRHVDEICHAHAQPHQSRGSMEGWKDGRMEGWQDGRMEGWKDGRTEGWKDGRTEGWKDGRMEGWKDGRMERWRDGRITPYKVVVISCQCAPSQ